MPEHIDIEPERRGRVLRDGLYQALAQAAVAATCDERGHSQPLRILDVGAGRGELLQLFQDTDHEVVGVDPEPECVAAASRYGPCAQAGVDDLPSLFAPGSFDVVVCSHVLEHLERPLEALRTLSGLEAQLYVFAVPNVHRSARLLRLLTNSGRPDHAMHIYGWGKPEFEAALRAGGFEVQAWHTDRVTISAVGGNFGARLNTILTPLEVKLLPWLFPALSSSLIATCRRKRGTV